jgi:hypothetical protein
MKPKTYSKPYSNAMDAGEQTGTPGNKKPALS